MLTAPEVGVVGGLAVRQVRHLWEFYGDKPGATVGALAKDAGVRGTAGMLLFWAASAASDPVGGLRPAIIADSAWQTVTGAIALLLASLTDEYGLKSIQKHVTPLQKPLQYGTENVQNLLWWFESELLRAFYAEDAALRGERARYALDRGLHFVSTFTTTRYENFDPEDWRRLTDQASQVLEKARGTARGDLGSLASYEVELRNFYQSITVHAVRGAGHGFDDLLDLPSKPQWDPAAIRLAVNTSDETSRDPLLPMR